MPSLDRPGQDRTALDRLEFALSALAAASCCDSARSSSDDRAQPIQLADEHGDRRYNFYEPAQDKASHQAMTIALCTGELELAANRESFG